MALLFTASGASAEPEDAKESIRSMQWRGLGSSASTGVHDKFEFTPRTVAALILTCLCALLANAAGIGGGPIYLPLLMVVMGFDLTPATALSHTIVATSAVASSIYGLIATSPNDPTRPLIDWDLTIFIPALLIGVSIGVFANVLMPSWLQTVLLTILLLIVIRKTLAKGLKMWQSEKKDVQLKRKLEEDARYHEEDSESDNEGVLQEEAYHMKPHRVTKTQSQQRLDLQDGRMVGAESGSRPDAIVEEANGKPSKSAVRSCLGRQPYFQIFPVVILWVVFLIFQQLKTRYGNCSSQYLGLFSGEVLLLLAFTIAGIVDVSRKSKRQPGEVDPELREVLLPDTSAPTNQQSPVKRLTIVAAVMTFAGALAGLLGIGGALIFNPFLLALGVHPQVTASTSVLMILFSSSAISISLGFQGYLNTSYAAVYASVAFVSSIVGVTLVGKVIKKTGHTSIIVFILTFLIAIGTILTAVFGGIKAVEDFRNGTNIGFDSLC